MWERVEERLALLELLTEGTLKRRTAQAQGFAWLSELSWTRATGRRNEIRLVADRRAELVELLDRVWPEWKSDHLALVVAGEPPRPRGGPASATSAGPTRFPTFLRRSIGGPRPPPRPPGRSPA